MNENCEPYPNERFSDLITFFEEKGSKLTKDEMKKLVEHNLLAKNFSSSGVEYDGYVIVSTYGQGIVFDIHKAGTYEHLFGL